MKLRLRALGAGVAVASVTAGLMVAMSGPASATSPLPHDPSYELGTLAFYDASGARVTHGSLTDDPFSTYAVASTDDPVTTNTKATLYGYLPVNGVAPGAWSGEVLSASTTFPVVGGPAQVTLGANRPVATSANGDTTLDTLTQDYPNAASDSYAGMYQLRVKTAGNTKWWSADIQVDTGAGTWTQVYPDVTPTASATSLAVSPASPSYVGQAVTLTANVTPTGATGTVQFKDGGADLGAPVAVTSDQAQLTTSALAEGTHSLTAVFTAADPVSYAGSTSTAKSYAVLGAPAWRPVLAGYHRVGLTDSCLASFANNASLTYAWYVNDAPVAGATAATYKPAESYYGKYLTCRVTASNPAGTATAVSLPYKIGVGPALVPTARPYLSGPHHYGSYEVCNRGTWSPAAQGYYYQWYVGSYKISGATAYRYLVPKAYYGKVISCVVTVRRTYWTNGAYRTPGVKIT